MTDAPPRAVIDIGSNSVRLVVYGGPARAPLVRFNEKVMVGLGRELPVTGAMGADARGRAEVAIVRFGRLAAAAGVERPLIVATAAVRDASDGPALVDRLAALDLPPRVLSGEEEGRMSALGVRAGLPGAAGVVADLGGGSLELARLEFGGVERAISLPLGVLRVGEARGRPRRLAKQLAAGLKAAGWRAGAGEPLWLVGGSFRALAALDSSWRGRRPPALHGLTLAPDRAAALARRLGRASADALASLPSVSSARRPQMPAAAAILAALVDRLAPSRLVVSATGLREGVLYEGLDEATRARDPLLDAVRAQASTAGVGVELGGSADHWIAPLFDDEPAMARLRLAAAHLAGTGWRANPSFRAERAAETAFHGNWTGVDPRGRAVMAAAMDACFGGGSGLADQLATWCDAPPLARATEWGLALRLAQRFTGGAMAVLGDAQLIRDSGRLELRLTGGMPAGEVVERRLRQLAGSLDCEGVVVDRR